MSNKKEDWKVTLDKVNRVTSATDLLVVPLDGERLLVFKGGEFSLKFNDRGKVIAFLDQEQTKQAQKAEVK